MKVAPGRGCRDHQRSVTCVHITAFTMSKPNVPPEIIDHIFRQLDPTTLATCSHANPYLSAFAEPHLYADIVVFDAGETEIDAEDDRRTFLASDLHKLLIDSPQITKYVRKLEICLYTIAADRIAPILPMLLQLEVLFVTSVFYGYWQQLSREFREAFTDRLSSSFSILKEVSIIRLCNFPLSIYDNCKTVKRIGFYGQTNYEHDLEGIPPVLDSLSLRDWDHPIDPKFMDWARKCVHNLRFLSFCPRSSTSINRGLPELLRMCSNSLRSLEVSLNNRNGPTCVDLSSVPHLKDLTIRSDIWFSTDQLYEAFTVLMQLLETTPHLNNLILKLTSGLYGEITFDETDWSPLLTFLSRSSDKFQHIEIHLLHYTESIRSVDTIPQLYESEIISDLIAKGTLDIRMKKWTVY